jgi:hypothetical protein
VRRNRARSLAPSVPIQRVQGVPCRRQSARLCACNRKYANRRRDGGNLQGIEVARLPALTQRLDAFGRHADHGSDGVIPASGRRGGQIQQDIDTARLLGWTRLRDYLLSAASICWPLASVYCVNKPP